MVLDDYSVCMSFLSFSFSFFDCIIITYGGESISKRRETCFRFLPFCTNLELHCWLFGRSEMNFMNEWMAMQWLWLLAFLFLIGRRGSYHGMDDYELELWNVLLIASLHDEGGQSHE